MIASNLIANGAPIAGRYVVGDLIGRGRSSLVYKALDRETRSTVALKVLDPDLAGDTVSAERFRREATILRNLHHPGIITAYDLFESDGWTFISMEYFEGLNVRAHLEKFGRLRLPEFLEFARSLFSVLDACHRARVVHRDIKPHNILLDRTGALKVVDFGVSKMTVMTDLTKTGTVIGTPEYTAPEAFQSRRYDSRADIYGAGATLYELLTGRPPYVASSLAAVMNLQMRGEIEPIETFRKDVPRWLSALVFKCLRISPDERYQSAYEVQRDLERGDVRIDESDQRIEAATCHHCNGSLLAGLAFCHHCGALRNVKHEAGEFHLVLDRCEQKDRFVQVLLRTCPGVSEPTLRRRLTHLPLVVVSGISRQTAADLRHQLAPSLAELRLVNRLVTTFELSGVYLVIALAIFIPGLLMGTTTSRAIPSLVGTGLAEGLIYFLYRQRTRPLLTAKEFARASGPAIDDLLRPLLERVKEVRSERLRTRCAFLLRSLIALRSAKGGVTRVGDVADVHRSVSAAIDAAVALDRYEVYLAASSINDLREKRSVVDMRLARNPSLEESTRLIDSKAEIDREIINYQEIEDRHGEISVSLVNLQAALQRLVDTGIGVAVQTARDDVRAVTSYLTSLRDVAERSGARYAGNQVNR